MPAHLALVEPLILNDVLDRPDLGAAHLVSAVGAAGYPVGLVTAQTHFLRRIFLEGLHSETLELLRAAGRPLAERLGRARVARLEQWLDGERLAELYGRTLGSDRLADFLDSVRLELLESLAADIFRVYLHHLARLGNDDLSLVHETAARVAALAPRAVGFSAKYAFDPLTRAIVRRVRRLGVPVVLGGSRLTYLRGPAIARVLGREGVDYVVVGEGEQTLPALLGALADGEREPRLPGVYYLRRGELVDHGLAAPPDLASLPPPDFSGFDLDRYLSPEPVLPLQYGRGCSWRRCGFCAHHAIYQRTWRSFSAARVHRTMAGLNQRHGVRHFVLHDEELPPADCRRLSQELLAGGAADWRLAFYGRTVERFDRPTFRLMHSAGFRAAAWGVESLSQPVLERMDKGTSAAQTLRVLADARREGIANLCFLLFGFPGESRAEALETVAALAAHHETIDHLLPNSFQLDPSSPAAEEPERFGIEILPPAGAADPDEVESAYLPAFRVRAGMQPDEASRFVDRLLSELRIGALRATADRTRFLPVGLHASRLLVFLLAARGVVAGVELDGLLSGDGERLWPVVLGAWEGQGAERRFRPVRHDEPSDVTRLKPLAARALDSLGEWLVGMADGERSLADLGRLAEQLGLSPPGRGRDEVGACLAALAAERAVLGLVEAPCPPLRPAGASGSEEEETIGCGSGSSPARFISARSNAGVAGGCSP